MGQGLMVERQDDLGTVALAALRYSMGKETGENSVRICTAIAKLMPYLSESDTRSLIYEVEVALSRYGATRHEWVELLTVLRRLDRP